MSVEKIQVDQSVEFDAQVRVNEAVAEEAGITAVSQAVEVRGVPYAEAASDRQVYKHDREPWDPIADAV